MSGRLRSPPLARDEDLKSVLLDAEGCRPQWLAVASRESRGGTGLIGGQRGRRRCGCWWLARWTPPPPAFSEWDGGPCQDIRQTFTACKL